jgi:hypothetical protein
MFMSCRPRLPAGAAVLLLALSALCCASGKEFSGPSPSPDGEQFVKDVYPMLLRDCAHASCHGMPERFFQLYGPGRIRMPVAQLSAATRVELDSGDPANIDELRHSYERALSMLATSENIEDTLLLRKPLETQAGGQGHKGVDDLGRNVFASKRDPGWLLLRAWAMSKGNPPTAAQVSALNEAAAAASDTASNSEAAP